MPKSGKIETFLLLAASVVFFPVAAQAGGDGGLGRYGTTYSYSFTYEDSAEAPEHWEQFNWRASGLRVDWQVDYADKFEPEPAPQRQDVFYEFNPQPEPENGKTTSTKPPSDGEILFGAMFSTPLGTDREQAMTRMKEFVISVILRDPTSGPHVPNYWIWSDEDSAAFPEWQRATRIQVIEAIAQGREFKRTFGRDDPNYPRRNSAWNGRMSRWGSGDNHAVDRDVDWVPRRVNFRF